MKNIVISGYYGFENIGDEAILDALIELIKKKIDQARIVVFSGDPRKTYIEHGVEAVEIGSGFNLKKLFLSSKNWKNLIKHIRLLGKCHLLIVGGGGILHDISFWDTSKFSLSKIALAKMMRKRVVVLGVGARKFRKKALSRLLTRVILNQADIVSVRDERSKQNLLDCGINPVKIKVTIDPAISLTPVNEKKVESIFKRERIPLDGDKIGISIRWNLRRASVGNPFHRDFITRMAAVTDFIIDTYKVNVIFIPMEFPPRYPTDIHIMKKVVTKLTRRDKAWIIRRKCTPREILRIFGKMDLILGMRLHSLIFATRMCVPSVGIIYEPKVKSFLAASDQLNYAFSPEDKNLALIFKKIDKAWSERKFLKKRLETKREKLLNLNEKNVDIIKTFLS